MTDTFTAPNPDIVTLGVAVSGPSLLTEDEIAVGGDVRDVEIPYIEGTLGAGLIGSGAVGGAIVTGVVLAGAPVLDGLAMAGFVVTAGVGMWMLYDLFALWLFGA